MDLCIYILSSHHCQSQEESALVDKDILKAIRKIDASFCSAKLVVHMLRVSKQTFFVEQLNKADAINFLENCPNT